MPIYNKPLVVAPRTNECSPQVITAPSHNTICIFPPKCAQTSLRRWVGHSADIVSPTYYRNVEGNETVIMSVRNPLERLASAHANKFEYKDFAQFVELCCKHTDQSLDIHVQSQSYLLRRVGRRTPDYFIRVDDNLIHDVFALKDELTWLGCSVEHLNMSAHATALSLIHEHGQELYNMVRARYAEDFELWEKANG